ncbi:Ubiquitin carboxyl-terminal hydrolase 26 [Mortierella sp. GBA30]|nr:Ubiquitin carboxyl-terminal hydrolase 26 [Mortierella sp. GBA30]
MKKSDGSLVPASKLAQDSKKRKSTSKQGDRFDSFSGYGVDSIQGDEQDENQKSRTSFVHGRSKKNGGVLGQSHGVVTSGVTSAKRHKTPSTTQQSHSGLLNYFSRVPLHERNSNTVMESEVHKSLKALQDEVQKSNSQPEVDLASNDRSSRETSNVSGSESVIPGDQDDISASVVDVAKPGENECHIEPSSQAVPVDAPKQTDTIPVDEVESKSLTECIPRLSKVSLKSPETHSEVEDSKRGNGSVQVTTLDSEDGAEIKAESNKKTQPRPRPVKRKSRVPGQGEVNDELSEESKDIPRTGRLMQEFFKPRPKSSNSPPKPTPDLDPRALGIDGSTPSSATTSRKSESIASRSPAQESVDTLVEANLNDNGADLTDLTAEKPEQMEAVVVPERRRRLFRACDLATKIRDESSSDDETDHNRRSRKSKVRGKPRQEGKESSPEQVQAEETVPTPESESEPEHTEASRQLMRSFFGVSTAPRSNPPTTPTPTLAKVLTSDRSQTKNSGSTEPLQPSARPTTLKTYSRANKSKKTVRKKRSTFSDSEQSGSERTKGSDDDLDDFMNDDEKPDPNQKAITAMFAKAPAVLTKPISIKPEKKHRVLPSSQVLLSGGLLNPANICYLNSVLQALRNTPGCKETLFAVQDKINLVERTIQSHIGVQDHQRSFFDNALQLFRSLDEREQSRADGDASLENTLYAKDVILPLQQGNTQFNSPDQQDAAEFLSFVIDLFKEVLEALLSLEHGRESRIVPTDWQPMRDMFQICTEKVIRCQKCPSVSVHNDESLELNIQIDADHPTEIRDLDWGISETLKEEHMTDDNQRFCDRCNSKEDARVSLSLKSLPKIMVLRLQRNSYLENRPTKLQHGVSCAERMSFDKWLSSDYKGPHPNYELCAIIIHRGRTVNSGHYYAYIQKNIEMETEITEPDGACRIEKKSFRWLRYNDSKVKPISDEHMARIFSGNVSVGSGCGENDLGDFLSPSNTPFEDDVATPYVYIFKRTEA